MHFLGELILILLTTHCSQLFNFNLPAVIGQLLSGILLGPAILNWFLWHNQLILWIWGHSINVLADLESDLDLLKKYQVEFYGS